MVYRCVLRAAVGVAVVCLSVYFGAITVNADTSSSSNYMLDSTVGGSFGGQTSSTNYALTSVGGQSVSGNGAAGSYLLSDGYTSQLNQAIQLFIQPGGMAAYYRLDEGRGNVAHDWTIYDHPAQADPSTPVTWSNASFNSDKSFDQGASSAYLVTSSPPLTAVDKFTVSGTVYPLSTSTNMTLFAQDDFSGSGDAWNLSMNTSGKVVFSLQKAGSTVQVTSSQSLSASNWYMIVASYEGSVMKLYIDGSLDAQQANGAGSLNFTQPFSIGSRTNSSSPYYFNGLIDDVALYDRELSANDVYQLYLADVRMTSLGAVTPGVSRTSDLKLVVQTDAPSYQLGGRRYATATTPNMSGTLTTPVLWDEGTTKGLGFTVSGAPSGIESKWGASPNYKYAAFPSTSTTLYTRSGYTGGVKDALTLQIRLDYAADAAQGNRNVIVDFVGTTLP